MQLHQRSQKICWHIVEIDVIIASCLVIKAKPSFLISIILIFINLYCCSDNFGEVSVTLYQVLQVYFGPCEGYLINADCPLSLMFLTAQENEITKNV